MEDRGVTEVTRATEAVMVAEAPVVVAVDAVELMVMEL